MLLTKLLREHNIGIVETLLVSGKILSMGADRALVEAANYNHQEVIELLVASGKISSNGMGMARSMMNAS